MTLDDTTGPWTLPGDVFNDGRLTVSRVIPKGRAGSHAMVVFVENSRNGRPLKSHCWIAKMGSTQLKLVR